MIIANTKTGIRTVLLVLLVAASAKADVLQDRDTGAITGLFGLPDSTEGSDILGKGDHRWELSVTHASHAFQNIGPTEVLNLDGETSRLEFRYRIGVTDKLELGLHVPYMRHQSGGLDSFIDSWHDFFGFPEGARDVQPQDVLAFQYADSSGTILNFMNSEQGFGDVRLIGGWRIKQNDKHNMALRFGIKFATGDSDHLLGSGAMDANIGIAGEINSLFGAQSLTGFYRAHVVYLGEADVLDGRNRDWSDYVSLGAGWRLGERFELRAQAASHAGLFNSELYSLEDRSAALTLGGNVRIGDNYELSIGVSEDVNVGTTADVTFQVAFRYLPRD